MVLWWWMFFGGGFVPPLKVSGIPFPFTRGQLFGTTLSHHHGYPTSRKLFLWQIIWLDISVTSRSTICKHISYTKTSRMQHPLICKVPSTSTPNHHRSSPVLQQMELFLVPIGAGSHCFFSAVFHCHPKHRFEINVPQPTTIDISIKYINPNSTSERGSIIFVIAPNAWLRIDAFHGLANNSTDYTNKLRQFIWGVVDKKTHS